MPALGQYRNRVTLQAPGPVVPDVDGGYTDAMLPLAPPAWWCSIQPATQKDMESYAAGSVLAQGTHIVKGPYHPGITTQTQVLLGGAPQPYADLVKAHGASHYWRLDDTGSVALDIIGGATGTISGGVTRGVPGALIDGNAAMAFDGASGRIATTANVLIPVICTIDGWVNFTTTGPNVKTFFTTRNLAGASGDTLAVGTQGLLIPSRPTAFSGAQTVLGDDSTRAGEWMYLAYVLNGSTIAFYVNGAFDSQTAFVRTTSSTGPASIGFDPGVAAYLGTIDDVAIYPRALSAAEIAAHYDAGTKKATRILNVLAVANRDERSIETDLICAEVVK